MELELQMMKEMLEKLEIFTFEAKKRILIWLASKVGADHKEAESEFLKQFQQILQ